MNSPPAIRPRRMNFPFDPQTVPKYWFGGNASASMRVNAINLVFPEGERFFVRSVRRHLPLIEDDDLKQRARQFFAQETLHGHEHDRATAVLEHQGFEIESWLAWYRGLAYERIEPLAPAVLCLSVTAALEHLTASLAHYHLTTDPMHRAAPVMQDLMRWHASEEIEHKSVAFDVLQTANGSWLIRVIGMVLAVIGFLFFWGSAWRHLRRQDPNLTRARVRADVEEVRSWGIHDARRAVLGYALAYLRPSFHPDDVADYPLAEAALNELESRYPSPSKGLAPGAAQVLAAS
jgi:uncharacterized protein